MKQILTILTAGLLLCWPALYNGYPLLYPDSMSYLQGGDFSMFSVNIRQLRDTRKLKAWLRAGKTVELRDRNKVIARIVPAQQNEIVVNLPDFAACRKEIFGERVLPGADLVIEERGRY